MACNPANVAKALISDPESQATYHEPRAALTFQFLALSQRLDVPDMSRLGLKVEQQGITHTHANRTLVVSVAKPPQILELEAQARAARKSMKVSKEGDADCKQQ